MTVTINARKVTVTGPRGSLTREFKHVALGLKVVKGGRRVLAEMWFGTRLQRACIRSVVSAIENMIFGVTKGFKYKMRLAYAHFPINVGLEEDGKVVALRNFLGEKKAREVAVLPGVTVARSADVKDEIVLTGNDINSVSQCAANVQQAVRVTTKDIRKFLDGVYRSSAGFDVED